MIYINKNGNHTKGKRAIAKKKSLENNIQYSLCELALTRELFFIDWFKILTQRCTRLLICCYIGTYYAHAREGFRY